MPAPRLLAPVALLLVLTITPGAAADPADWPEHRRIYLGAADSQHAYWTVDPDDPELSLARLVQDCGLAEHQNPAAPHKPCFSGFSGNTGEYAYTTYFMPGSLFRESPAWEPSAPLRFHLEMDVDALAEYEVSLVLQQGTSLWESSAATEVAPGVFEGELTARPLPFNDSVNLFGVRVRTTSSRLVSDLALRGVSWLELPVPVAGRSVPGLMVEDAYRPAPTSFAAGTRGFTFNDARWDAWSFEGEFGDTATFDLSLPEQAETVVAWIDLFDSPFVHDVVRRGSADHRKLVEGGAVRLLRGGEEVARSAGPFIGQGTGGLAALEVAGGDLTLEASRLGLTDDTIPFTAHVVATYGDRTLRSMRWRELGQAMFRMPAVASCPGASEAVPVSDEVASWRVDMEADSESVGLPAWTISYALPTVGDFPCGEDAGGDWVRFTIPGERVAYVGPAPAEHGAFASAADAAFDWEVRYTYTAPPVA